MAETIKYSVESYTLDGLGFEYRFMLPGDKEWRVGLREQHFNAEKIGTLKERAEKVMENLKKNNLI